MASSSGASIRFPVQSKYWNEEQESDEDSDAGSEVEYNSSEEDAEFELSDEEDNSVFTQVIKSVIYVQRHYST